MFGNWGTDSIVYARSAPPVNVVTGLNPFPLGQLETGYLGVAHPNLVSGVPLWVSDPNVAGGQKINPAAFAIPTGAVQGDLGRNALRGFGATQVDLALQAALSPQSLLRLPGRRCRRRRRSVRRMDQTQRFPPPTMRNYLRRCV